MSNLLSKLRILDENGTLSLTNIALMAAVAKACISPTTSIAEWLTIAATLGSYQFKRWHGSKQTDQEAFDDRIKQLESHISAIKSGLALKR